MNLDKIQRSNNMVFEVHQITAHVSTKPPIHINGKLERIEYEEFDLDLI